MTKNEHYLMRDDIAKKIFKDTRLGKRLTARVLSGLLNVPEDIIFNDLVPGFTEIANDTKTVNSEADIVYTTSENVVDVEINYFPGPQRNGQMNAYINHLFIGQIKSSKDYLKAKGIIQVLIEDYDFFKKDKFIYKVVPYETSVKLEEKGFFIRYHVSLDYLSKKSYNNIVNDKDLLEKTLYFLIGYDEEKRNIVYGDDEFMKEVVENAETIAGRENTSLFMSDDEITRLDQEYHQKVGYQKGVEEGMQKKQIEMIHNLNKCNVPIETIAEAANMTSSEIQKILNNK